MSGPILRIRRTQEERSTATRARLLDATIQCLHELGYANTTTTEIAIRAGVSRGAQLHHFPTKADLVTTAVQHLFDRRVEEFRQGFRDLPPGADRVAGAIDLLWSILSGPSFHAWVELMVASRTDPALAETVGSMATRFADTVQQTFGEIFPRQAEQGPYSESAPAFAFALLQGLALEKMVMKDDERARSVLNTLRAISSLALS